MGDCKVVALSRSLVHTGRCQWCTRAKVFALSLVHTEQQHNGNKSDKINKATGTSWCNNSTGPVGSEGRVGSPVTSSPATIKLHAHSAAHGLPHAWTV